CTRTHPAATVLSPPGPASGLLSAQLVRIGWRIGAFVHTFEWHVMHVSVGGMPAKLESSTDVWQYRQSIPSPFTWCSWLNGTGCGRTTPCRVRYGDFCTPYATHASAAITKIAPKIVARAIVLAA